RRTRTDNKYSLRILQPSPPPKNDTLDPTTGQRSSRTGDSRDVKLLRNFRSALVGKIWPSLLAAATAAAWAAPSLRPFVRGSQSKRPTLPTADLAAPAGRTPPRAAPP